MPVAFALMDLDGGRLDARFEIIDSGFILHSRGGNKGKGAINPDYSKVLRLMLQRLADHAFTIAGAWVDSSRVQGLSLKDREILGVSDTGAAPDELFRRLSKRMQSIGQSAPKSGSHGNSTKKIRVQLAGSVSIPEIARALNAITTGEDLRSLDRLTAETLNKVTAEYVWQAVQALMNGVSDHGFGESTDYDLISDNGDRFPPKAVFGLAATYALGHKVLPKHFTAGEGSPCFRILRASGYQVEAKLHSAEERKPPSYAKTQWAEGNDRLASHRSKERGSGLSSAKKAEFRRVNGKLFCERCGLDPIASFGTVDGEACIEAHHRAVQVKDMIQGHATKLEDLQCLCANCHRFVHRLLSKQLETDLR